MQEKLIHGSEEQMFNLFYIFYKTM